ncbi:MAG: methyl-accepting chemotaxis protein [Proteobacteria bacterium]|nr:methyl-accepting chemotaxis protein [Pseudomonadota bacterium]
MRPSPVTPGRPAPITRDPEQAQRRRLLSRFGVGFGLMNMGFVPFLFVLSAYEAALITAVTTPIMTASPLFLRWTGSLDLSATILVASTVLLFGGVSVFVGGLEAPTMPVLPVAPILALFLISRASGFFWSIVVIGLIAAFFAAKQLDVALPQLIPDTSMPIFRAMGLATIVGVSLIFLLQYDVAKSDALAAVKRSNRRLVELIGHLNATSAALSRSAAEFLGTDLDEAGALDQASATPSSDVARTSRPGMPGGVLTERSDRAGGHSPDARSAGLTQQMLSTANFSREMIVGVGAAIRGMIGQYTSISQRIHELHQQSGTIAELVETIDSISDRLDLMALNTGIEAAHAGEQGKRFQLLADDMRRLAERVLDETHRIKSSIRAVQTHTQAAIDASTAGQALTDEGTLKLEAMSRTFDDMHRLIERTADASQRITNDTIAQLTTIHNLVSESLRSHDS